ncbi:hypothetical protein PSHT_01753 [Puccinia striiformis]|uniref:Uncharacterized protein n=1 Tax=Puccinia striiformis TaxID=27350 RepID=A0A2S4WK28_9BASI|nr:hypothetical protein PSHT_01753 [Puccinia striiformis]
MGCIRTPPKKIKSPDKLIQTEQKLKNTFQHQEPEPEPEPPEHEPEPEPQAETVPIPKEVEVPVPEEVDPFKKKPKLIRSPNSSSIPKLKQTNRETNEKPIEKQVEKQVVEEKESVKEQPQLIETEAIVQEQAPIQSIPLPVPSPIQAQPITLPPPTKPEKHSSQRRSRNSGTELTLLNQSELSASHTHQALFNEPEPPNLFRSRKSFNTDYDTSRDSNATTTNLTPNLLFMEHRIQELELLLEICQDREREKLLKDQLQIDQNNFTNNHHNRIDSDVNLLQSHIQHLQIQFDFKSLDYKLLENQLAIKDHQINEIIEHFNQIKVAYNWKTIENEKLKKTIEDWIEIGTNFEALIELERNEKSELNSNLNEQLSKIKLDLNFEINNLKYNLLQSENKNERLIEQFQESNSSFKNLEKNYANLKTEFEQSKVSDKVINDKLIEELRAKISEQESEINGLKVGLNVPIHQPKSTKLNNEQEEEEEEEDIDHAVDDPTRLITSDSWVSIGLAAKKLSKKSVKEKGTDTSKQVDLDIQSDVPPTAITRGKKKVGKGKSKQINSDHPPEEEEEEEEVPPPQVVVEDDQLVKSTRPVRAKRVKKNDTYNEEEQVGKSNPTCGKPKKAIDEIVESDLILTTNNQEEEDEEDHQDQEIQDVNQTKTVKEKKVTRPIRKKQKLTQEDRPTPTPSSVVQNDLSLPSIPTSPSPISTRIIPENLQEEEAGEGGGPHVENSPKQKKTTKNSKKITAQSKGIVDSKEIGPSVVGQEEESPQIATTSRTQKILDNKASKGPNVDDHQVPGKKKNVRNTKKKETVVEDVGDDGQEDEDNREDKMDDQVVVPDPILTTTTTTTTNNNKNTKKGKKDSKNLDGDDQVLGKKKNVRNGKKKGTVVEEDEDNGLEDKGDNGGDKVDDQIVVPDPIPPATTTNNNNNNNNNTKKKSSKKRKSNDISNPPPPTKKKNSPPKPNNVDNHVGNDDDDDDGTIIEETINKKKRKIFHHKKPALTWANEREDENNMLGLPPILSPIKKTSSSNGGGKKISSSGNNSKRNSNNILPSSLMK